MTVEKILTDELHVVGSSLKTPPPPEAAILVRRADRVRAGKRVRVVGSVLLAAAAIAAAVAIGNQVRQPDAGPDPVPQPTELPTGNPPQIPYVGGSTLYLGDQVLKQGSWEGVTTRGRTSIADLAAGGETPATMVVFRDNTENFRVVGPEYQSGTAVLSPDGSKLAWIAWNASEGNSFFLVERDVATDRELGRLPVDAAILGHVGEETEAWEQVSRVANDGTVTYGGVVEQHTWKPGSAPVDHNTDYVGPDLAGYPPGAENVVVNADNTWAAWSTDHNGNPYPGDASDYVADAITLQRPEHPGSRYTIKLPTGGVGGLFWESTTVLLTVVFDDPDATSWHFVRCDIETRRCELAPTQTGP